MSMSNSSARRRVARENINAGITLLIPAQPTVPMPIAAGVAP